MSAAVIELDARRLLCPMPVIRLQDALQDLPAGARIEVYCTDPGTMSDIPTWCRINGHSVISCQERDYEFIFLVEKSGDDD